MPEILRSEADSQPSRRYTAVAIVLHWTIAAAIVGMILLGWNMSDLPNSNPLKGILYQTHKSIGITLLVLTLARIGWRLLNPPPPLPPMPGWQRRASEAVHIAFYVLMILMPLTGWILVSAAPISLPTLLFDTIPWPHIPGFADVAPATRKALFPLFENMHGKLAWLMFALLALHVGAAIHHHFLVRDGLIARMAPGLFGRAESPLRPGRGVLLAFGCAIAVFLLVVVLGQAFGSTSSRSPDLSHVEPQWVRIDSGSSMVFRGKYDGQAFEGRFVRWDAAIRFDPGAPEDSRIAAWIDMDSARTGNAYYDETLHSPDWFDAANHQYALFSATGAEKMADDHFALAGRLTLKGQDYDMRIPLHLHIDGEIAKAQAVFPLDRIALGIGVSSDPDGTWVARRIDVSLTIEARRPLAG